MIARRTMKNTMRRFGTALLLLIGVQAFAGNYYLLCEGNFTYANASLWSTDDAFASANGPLIWDTSSNPLGDVGQSMTIYGDVLYIVMNNSHQIRMVDLVTGAHLGDIDLPGAEPRYMAVQPSMNRAFISSWGVLGLIVMDMDDYSFIDTIEVNMKPEQVLIQGDQMFVSMNMDAAGAIADQVFQWDISLEVPYNDVTYQVADGPGSMALDGDLLYVTSIYYDESWNSYSASNAIDVNSGTVLIEDHGAYNAFTADVDVLAGVPYRIYDSEIVPLNADMTLNTAGSISGFSSIYSMKVVNDHFVLGISDFVAPDEVLLLDAAGTQIGSATVGAIPGDVVYFGGGVSLNPDLGETPQTLLLGANYPNPFNPQTRIPFELARASHVNLSIYDLQGRLLHTLVSEYFEAGAYTAVWDGSDMHQNPASSGIYLAKLTADDEQHIIKMNLLK